MVKIIGDKKTEYILNRLEKIEKRSKTMENYILENTDALKKELKSVISQTKILKDEIEKLWHFVWRFDDMIADMEKKNVKTMEDWKDIVKSSRMRVFDLEDDIKSIVTSRSDTKKALMNLNDRIEDIEKQNNVILNEFVNRMKDIEERYDPERMKGLENLKDQVEGMRKSMLSFNKLWIDYKKGMDEKLRQPLGGNIVDELNSLKRIVSEISAENDRIKRMAKDIRVAQFGMTTPDMFTSMASKVKALEEKIIELKKRFDYVSEKKPIVLE